MNTHDLRTRLEAVNRFDAAAEAAIDDDTPPDWKDGHCACSCNVTARDANGKLARTDACSCTRVAGIRVDEHGDPKFVIESCAPPALPRRDADDLPHFGGVLGPIDRYTRSVPVMASTTSVVDGLAITRWDLTRFAKNPVILWAHDAGAMPIGLARDLAFAEGVGLTMTIDFAPATVNDFAEQCFRAVEAGLLRGVSVGFSVGPDGVAELAEVSLCAVPADENALVITPPESEDSMTTKLNTDANEAAQIATITDAKTTRDNRAANAWRGPGATAVNTDARAMRSGVGGRKRVLSARLGERIRGWEWRALKRACGGADPMQLSADRARGMLKDARSKGRDYFESAKTNTDAADFDPVTAARAVRDSFAADAWRHTNVTPRDIAPTRTDAQSDPLDIDAARARRDQRMASVGKPGNGAA